MRKIASLLLLLAVNGCVAAYPATTITSSEGDAKAAPSVKNFRTFSIGSAATAPAGYTAARGAETTHRFEGLVAAALKERGYVQVADKGDFVVHLGAGRRQVSVQEQSQITPDWQPTDQADSYTESVLALDADDRKNGTNLWHGVTRTKLDAERASDGDLKHLVDELVARFPQSMVH